MRNANLPSLIILVGTLVLTGCGGGSGGGSASNSSGTVSLSGTVSIASSDLSYATAVQQASLGNASVQIYKIFPDGTEQLAASTTTDSNGSYRVDNLEPAAGGTGSNQDFYYEVRATSGSIDVRAPAAPTSDKVVDVTPASNLAAKILSDVVDIPASSSVLPVPDPALIEATRERVKKDVTTLDASIKMPSTGDTSASSQNVAMANGLAAAGGDAEKIYKAVQFASESEWLKDNTNNASASDAGAYIQRVVREACGQPDDNPVPAKVTDILGDAMLKGDTFTITQLVGAYNNHMPASQQIDVASAVSKMAARLATIKTDLDGTSASIGKDDQLLLYVSQGQATLSPESVLTPDQAIPFLLAALDDGNGSACITPLPITDIMGELTGDTSLQTAHISDVVIYHDMGFGCTTAGKGHFRAAVAVYAPPAVSVTGVTVTSTDPTALGGDGTEALSLQGERWVSQTDGVCVTLDSSVNYTITATLSDSSTVQTTVSRTHPLVPEATATIDGVSVSSSSATPTVVAVPRPLFSWQSPADMLATITNAPAGSTVKYRYEFSHVDITDSPVAPLAQCSSVSSGPMYAVDDFLPTVDCDPAACAAATGRNQANLSCRINIQTYLLDERDRIRGQAAGNFSYFCVDTDNDGNCG